MSKTVLAPAGVLDIKDNRSSAYALEDWWNGLEP
jgi:hypothetical protein